MGQLEYFVPCTCIELRIARVLGTFYLHVFTVIFVVAAISPLALSEKDHSEMHETLVNHLEMFVAILAILGAILCVFALKRGTGERPPLATGGWPIIGHTLTILKHPEELFKILIEFSMDSLRQGGAVIVRIGAADIYSITDPEDANLVLNSCLKKDVIYDYFKPWLGDGLISASATLPFKPEHNIACTLLLWKKHRKLLNPTFNQTVLDNYLLEFNKQASSLVKHLDAKAGKGKFDPAPYLEHTTLQTICSTAMGVPIDENDVALREEYISYKGKYNSGLVHRAQTFWLHSDLIYNLSKLKKCQEDLARTLHGLTNTFIKKRKTEMSNRAATEEVRFKPFMELLLNLEKDGIMIDREVQEQVDSFTFAGSDTMSVTLTIVLMVIGSYPDIQRNIVEELQEVFNGSERDVEKQDLLKLKYLEAVVKESMRLFPTIILVARQLERDLKIRNYTIPSGSRCFVYLHGVNRHSSWGPDAEQFRPERWLEPASVPNYNLFASFGLGRRRCIGINYAMMSIKTVLAHVLRRYRVHGDVTQLVRKIEIVGRPVPRDYISIERRAKTDYAERN